MGKTDETPPYLSVETRIERLCLHSPTLVGQIYEVSLRILDSDARADAIVDSKANSLLGAVGLALTVTFTFGGLLLTHPELFSEIGRHAHLFTIITYSASLLVGLASGLFALYALLIKTYRAIDERTILDNVELRKADLADLNYPFLESSECVPSNNDEHANTAGASGIESDNEARINAEEFNKQKNSPENEPIRNGTSMYKRFLIVHYLNISQRNNEVRETKTVCVKKGQLLFILFIALLSIIGIVISWSAINPLFTTVNSTLLTKNNSNDEARNVNIKTTEPGTLKKASGSAVQTPAPAPAHGDARRGTEVSGQLCSP